MFSTPTIGQMMAETQAHLDRMAAKSSFECNGCICSGSWIIPCASRRYQYVAVPPGNPKTPEQLGFGPGWVVFMSNPLTGWVNWVRYLNERGGIDLTQFHYNHAWGPLAPPIVAALSAWHYQGIGACTPQPRWFL